VGKMTSFLTLQQVAG